MIDKPVTPTPKNPSSIALLQRFGGLQNVVEATQAPLFKGTLWKLNNDGNAQANGANGSKPACWGGVGIYIFSSVETMHSIFFLFGVEVFFFVPTNIWQKPCPKKDA